MPKAKQTISLEPFTELAKAHLAEPNAAVYNSDDIVTVVSCHKAFLVALAPLTQRLNPSSMGLAAKEVFKLARREEEQYASALPKAFAHCMSAGSKATTGQKLQKDVLDVWNASLKANAAPSPKTGIKAEPKRQSAAAASSSSSLKREVKEEPPEAARSSKSLKICLSSPSKIQKLYSGSSVVKAIQGACVGMFWHCIHTSPSAAPQEARISRDPSQVYTNPSGDPGGQDPSGAPGKARILLAPQEAMILLVPQEAHCILHTLHPLG